MQCARAAVIEAWVQGYRSAPTNHIDEARAVAVDALGNVVVTGHFRNGTGQDLKLGMYTAKYAAVNGALLWERRDENGLRPEALAFDGRGNVIVTGGNFYTVRYAATDGGVQWKQRHTGPSDGYVHAHVLAVDDSDNVVVAGTESNGTNSLFYTAKYAASDGALVWEQRFTAPNNHGYPSGIAIDRNNNVAITGVFHNSNGDTEPFKEIAHHYTLKLTATSGALLWEQHYSRAVYGWADFHGPDIAVDRSGNVIIAEAHDSPDTGTGGLYLAKYAAADGEVLWEKGPNASGNWAAQTVAVDGKGNVAVLGQEYTAKYAATDGALIWERRYGETGRDGVTPTSVAFDDSGNVLMTGTTWKVIDNQRAESGYYTAKYAPPNGDLLWEKRFDVPKLDRLPSVPHVNTLSLRLALGPRHRCD